MSKADLVAIIRRQISRWPEASFNPSKIRKDVLQARILSGGFTTPNVAGPLSVDRSLELFIEDLREQPSNKFMQSLEFPSAGGLDGGGWLVNEQAPPCFANLAVLVGWFEARLFQPYDAEIFVGPVELSFDDPMHPGRKRYFVKTSGSAVLAGTSTSPVVLEVPTNSCLEIFVEDSAPASTVRKRERSVSDGDGSLPTTGSSEVTPAKKRTTRPDADDVQYPINVLSERPVSKKGLSSGRYTKSYEEINAALLSAEDGCPIHFKSIPSVVRDARGLGSTLRVGGT
ncbi:hypothetical protein FB451DRAFT_1164909 [Mycena latifolia]|nr:hypothetical protein FB451DRAFT_1164909 [Mycena latifolia]